MTESRRILVVEDSFLTAAQMKGAVERMGFVVLGPAPSAHEAISLIESIGCDGAVLDINLGDHTVEPVARWLMRAGKPFVFVSGYDSPSTLDPSFRGHPLLRKPVSPSALEQIIRRALLGPASEPGDPSKPADALQPGDPPRG
jgi:DNA-binding NarL/FixJ family response regulator